MYRTRLIDAVSYRKELEAEKTCCERTEELLMGLEIAIADLGDMPTIDPIHAAGCCYCKECAYCDSTYNQGVFCGVCKIRKDSWGCQLEVGLHDFCSNSKRKNGD